MSKQVDAPLERVLATLALVIISLISLANVVVRYFTDASFAFTEEISVFLLVILTFAGASVAMRSVTGSAAASRVPQRMASSRPERITGAV